MFLPHFIIIYEGWIARLPEETGIAVKMHDCRPVGKGMSPGSGQQVSCCFCPSYTWDEQHAPQILSFLCVPSHVCLLLPLNFAVFLRRFFHFKKKCREGPSLAFWIDQQWIHRRLEMLLEGKNLACNPSPATNRLLFFSCCFCCSTLHLIGSCELVSDVLSYSEDGSAVACHLWILIGLRQ